MARRVANTKHFRISKLLSEQIRFMAPGEMLPTVEDLKRRYESSQATITQAVERLRHLGVVERPAGKKRLVVSQIGTRPKFQVTLIRPLWSSPDYDSVANRIYELGHEEHFGFNVYVYSDAKHLNIDHALKQTDAALVIGDFLLRPDQIEAFNGSRKPIVFLRDKPAAIKAGSVWVDDLAVGKTATRHLLELGHKRIAVMLSEPPNPSSAARLRGWRIAMKKSGVKELNALISDCSVHAGEDSILGSYNKFSTWLDANHRDFTAIFCTAWTGALAAMRALRERSLKIPEDVSVITYASESPLCDFTVPPITTVQVDLNRYTRTAIRMIQDKLTGEDSPENAEEIQLDPHLVPRESTAKPRTRMRVNGRTALR